MDLHPAAQKLILHWGEMGTKWGINRTVAQIHILLFISPEPLHAEEISETLSVARSNVSTSLRELQSWQLIHVEQKLGDRRDYFSTTKDVWELFRTVLAERKKREVDPTLSVLREVAITLDGDSAAPAEYRRRVADLLDFMETMTGAYEQMNRFSTKNLVRLARTADRMKWFLGEE